MSSYTLVIFDSVRLRDKYMRQVGWHAFANTMFHVWDSRPYALDWATTACFSRVRAIGTDPDMLVYAEEYAAYLGAEFGSYPRVSPQNKDDRPQDYDAGAADPDSLDGQGRKYKTLRDVLAARVSDQVSSDAEEAAAERLPGDSDDT